METIWYTLDKALMGRLSTMSSDYREGSKHNEHNEHNEHNCMETYIASISAEITNKCDFTELRAESEDYVRVISFALSSTDRIGEVRYVVRKFLDIYPGVNKFIVRFKTTKFTMIMFFSAM